MKNIRKIVFTAIIVLMASVLLRPLTSMAADPGALQGAVMVYLVEDSDLHVSSDSNSEVVTSLPKGSPLFMTGQGDGWYAVSYQGQTLYVFGEASYQAVAGGGSGAGSGATAGAGTGASEDGAQAGEGYTLYESGAMERFAEEAAEAGATYDEMVARVQEQEEQKQKSNVTLIVIICSLVLVAAYVVFMAVRKQMKGKKHGKGHKSPKI